MSDPPVADGPSLISKPSIRRSDNINVGRNFVGSRPTEFGKFRTRIIACLANTYATHLWRSRDRGVYDVERSSNFRSGINGGRYIPRATFLPLIMVIPETTETTRPQPLGWENTGAPEEP